MLDLATIQDEVLKIQLQNHVRGIAVLMTLKHVFDKNVQVVFEQFLVDAYQQLDNRGNRDDLADLLSYLLRESEGLQKDQFWYIINQKFSSEVEEKTMTIAQEIETRGYEKGRQEGGEEREEIIAKRMLLAGCDVNTILKVTDLTFEKLMTLKKNSH